MKDPFQDIEEIYPTPCSALCPGRGARHPGAPARPGSRFFDSEESENMMPRPVRSPGPLTRLFLFALILAAAALGGGNAYAQDTHSISISPVTQVVTEGGTLKFTLTSDQTPTATAIYTVTLEVKETGDMVDGIGPTAESRRFKFRLKGSTYSTPAAELTGTDVLSGTANVISISTAADETDEDNSMVTLKITGVTGEEVRSPDNQSISVRVGTSSEATQTVLDDDEPVLLTAPGVPGNLEAAPQHRKVKLSWETPSDGGSLITGYQLRYIETGGTLPIIWTDIPSAEISEDSRILSYVVTGLTNGTRYTFEVRAMNSEGAGTASRAMATVAPATVGARVSIAPASSEVGEGDEVKFTLSFYDYPKDLQTSSIASGTIDLIVEVEETGMMLDGTPKTNFTLTMETNSAGEQPLEATKVTFDLKDIVEFESVNDETGEIDSQVTVTLISATVDQTHSGQLNDDLTSFEVASPFVATVTVGDNDETPEPPGALGSLTADPPEDSQVTLNWTAPGAGGVPTIYQYRQSTNGGTTWAPDWTDIMGSGPGGANVASYTVTGLTNGTEYTFEVRAKNALGEGGSSRVAATPATMPGEIQNLRADPGNTQVTLRWGMPSSDGGSSITSYQYRHKETTGGTFPSWPAHTAPGATAQSATVTGLTNDTEYTFEVRAVTAVKAGDSVSTTSTPTAPPMIGTIELSAPASGDTYIAGEHIDVTLRFTKGVAVANSDGVGDDTLSVPMNWSPSIRLNVGSDKTVSSHPENRFIENNNLYSGLVFRYTVADGDIDDDGVTVTGNSLDLSGVTFKLPGSSSLVLNPGHTERNFTDRKVDGVKPGLMDADVDGAMLTIIYDEELDGDSTPEADDFTVTVDGSQSATVSSPAVSGMTVTLTLSPAVAANQAVTVSYTPGASPIKDAAGNEAEGLSDETVINITGLPEVRVSFGASGYGTITEGGSVGVTVRLNEPPRRQVEIRLAPTSTDGADASDYSLPASVIFGSTETEKTLTFTATDDVIDEEDEETVTLGFASPFPGRVSEGAIPSATVKIADNDGLPALSIRDAQAHEEDGSVELEVTLTPASGKEVTVEYETADDTATQPSDYTSARGSLMFIAGETSKTITVFVLDDTDIEESETFTVTLSNAQNAVLSKAVATAIISASDNPAPSPTPPPSANAGEDRVAAQGEEITLDGSGSRDSGGGNALSYRWTYTGERSDVTLSGADTAMATFTAPSGLGEDTALEFQLVVTDSSPGGLSSSDTVSVKVTSLAEIKNGRIIFFPKSGGELPVGLEMLTLEVLPEGSMAPAGLEFELPLAFVRQGNVSRISFNLSPGEDPEAPSGYSAGGSAVDIEMDGELTGAQRATVCLPAGGEQEEPELYRYDEEQGRWEYLMGGAQTRGGAKSVCAQTGEVSLFGVFFAVIEDSPRVAVVAKAWLSRFGRVVADQMVEAVGGRINGNSAGRSGIREKPLEMPVPGDGAWLDHESEFEDDEFSRMDLRQFLLSGRSLELSSFEGGENNEAGNGWTFWARGAATQFKGEQRGLSIESDTIETGTLGADYDLGRMLVGIAVSHSRATGKFSMSEEGISGNLDSSVTGAHPYARFTLGERVSVWGLLGYGRGKMSMFEDGRWVRADISMKMGALGMRGTLVSGAEPGGFNLAVRTDVFAVRTESEEVEGLESVEADSSRLRLVLEGSRELALGSVGVLTPLFEAGLRRDGGDAENGTGFELGGGFRYGNPELGLTVELKARGLMAHRQSGYKEWGIGGSVQLNPAGSDRGLSVRVDSSLGAAASGVESLWERQDASGLASGRAVPAGRVDMEMSYGLAAFGGKGVVVPYAGYAFSGEGARTQSVGGRLSVGEGFSISLEGDRRENLGTAAEHGIILRGSRAW